MLCTNLKTVKQKSSVEFKCTSDLVFDTMVKFCIIIIFIVVVVVIAQLWITLRGNRCLPIVLVISILSLIPLVVKKSDCKNIVPVTHWGLPQGDFLYLQSPRLIQELCHWNITSDMTAFFPPLLALSAGENYWVFDAERPIRGPESIRTLGLSVSGIQAALRWGQDPSYNTYFFKSGSYWRFSPMENRVESIYPRSMQDWSGIPEDVDAAFRDVYGTTVQELETTHMLDRVVDPSAFILAAQMTWLFKKQLCKFYFTLVRYWFMLMIASSTAHKWLFFGLSFCFSGYAHFIRGRQYWKFDPVGMNSLEGYPRHIGMDFFGCSNVWGFKLFCCCCLFNLWRINLIHIYYFFLTMKRS